MASLFVKNIIPFKPSKKIYKTSYINFIKKVGFPYDLDALDKMISGFGGIEIFSVPEDVSKDFEKYTISSLYAIKRKKEYEIAFSRLHENEKIFSLSAGSIEKIKDSPIIGKYIYVNSYSTKIFNTKKEAIAFSSSVKSTSFSIWRVGMLYNGDGTIAGHKPVVFGCPENSSVLNILERIGDNSVLFSGGNIEISPYTIIEINALNKKTGKIDNHLVASVGHGAKRAGIKVVHEFEDWKDIFSSSFGNYGVDSFRIPIDSIPVAWVQKNETSYVDFFNGMKINKHDDDFFLSILIDDTYFIIHKSESPEELKEVSKVAIGLRNHGLSRGYDINSILPIVGQDKEKISIRISSSPEIKWSSPLDIDKIPNLVEKKKIYRSINSVLPLSDKGEDQNSIKIKNF